MKRKYLILFLNLLCAFFSFVSLAVAKPPKATSDQEYAELCAIAERPSIPGVYKRDILLSVRAFGAKGDGVTNDLSALQAAASALCQTSSLTRRTTLLFPKGTYRVQGTFALGEQDIKKWGVNYSNCSNVRIIGCDSTIETDGNGPGENFHKTSSANPAYAQEYQLIPFILDNFAFSELVGVRLYGNADHMTFDPSINAEGPDHGIITLSSHDWRISKLKADHFATDGLEIGDGLPRDSNFILDRVESAYNGRHGMAMLFVRDGIVTNSIFRNTGDAGIQYEEASGKLTPFLDATNGTGYVGPNAAIDIEPEAVLNPKGGNITFNNCQFLNNTSSYSLVSAHSDNIENITVRNSTFLNPPADAQTDCATNPRPYGVCSWPLWLNDGIAENLIIDAEKGKVLLGRGNPEDRVTFRYNLVTGQDMLLDAEGTQSEVLITDNTFIAEPSVNPYRGFFRILVQDDRICENRSWRFINNTIKVDASDRRPEGLNFRIGLSALLESHNRIFQSTDTYPVTLEYSYTKKIRDQLTPTSGWLPDGLGNCVNSTGSLSYAEATPACASPAFPKCP